MPMPDMAGDCQAICTAEGGSRRGVATSEEVGRSVKGEAVGRALELLVLLMPGFRS